MLRFVLARRGIFGSWQLLEAVRFPGCEGGIGPERPWHRQEAAQGGTPPQVRPHAGPGAALSGAEEAGHTKSSQGWPQDRPSVHLFGFFVE